MENYPRYCDRCFNKHNYKSYEEALAAIERIKARPLYSKKVGELEPYECRYNTGLWHVGHTK